MKIRKVSLEKQLEIVFQKLSDELSHATSGIIFLQIRDDNIGKFGIKHEPIDLELNRNFSKNKGLSFMQQELFLKLAIEALDLKHWTYGEIQLEFAVRKDRISIAVSFESNYNMSNYQALTLVSWNYDTYLFRLFLKENYSFEDSLFYINTS